MTGLSESELEASRSPVFAIIHELGNLMAGVRLQAYLLTDDPKPRALATASLELEDLSVKACALLSLVRPLLSPAGEATANARAVLHGLHVAMEDHVGQGVNVRIVEDRGKVDTPSSDPTGDDAIPAELPELHLDGELIRCLLTPLLHAGAEAARSPIAC